MVNKVHIISLAESLAIEYPDKITPLGKILEAEELEVFYDDYGLDTFDGMTIYDLERFFIHINTQMGNYPSSKRGRFTLAHELGHYFIDSHRIGLMNGLLAPHPSRTNKKQYHKIEREADLFASNLLMPSERFLSDIDRKTFGMELITELSDLYGVSKTACAFRLADIGKQPLLIIYAESNLIKWSYSSEDFPFKYLLYEDRPSPNSVMGEFYIKKNNDSYSTELVWAVDLFKYVKERDLQRKFFEYCLIFKEKALSIIWEKE